MEKIKIKCAFCKGTGKDPFDLLSQLAVCQVCKGTGKVEVMEPAIKCAFCKATGVYPAGARITCTVCNGKGMVTMSTGGGSAYGGKGATEECPKCRGAGAAKDSGLPCLKCGGKGVVSRKS
jgi:DnaJ-class molecular chaperone